MYICFQFPHGSSQKTPYNTMCEHSFRTVASLRDWTYINFVICRAFSDDWRNRRFHSFSLEIVGFFILVIVLPQNATVRNACYFSAWERIRLRVGVTEKSSGEKDSSEKGPFSRRDTALSGANIRHFLGRRPRSSHICPAEMFFRF